MDDDNDNLIKLDEHRPHILFKGDNMYWVTPLTLLEDIAAGRILLSECEDSDGFGRALAISVLDDLLSRDS